MGATPVNSVVLGLGVNVSGFGSASSAVNSGQAFVSNGSGASPSFVELANVETASNLGIGFSVASSALTCSLYQIDGASAASTTSPVTISMRSPTATSGGANRRFVTASLTLVVPSGATLGHTSNVGAPLYWYLLDNSGTLALAVCGLDLGESGITTSVAITTSSNSLEQVYSASALSGVPFRRIAKTYDTQTTAGTWASVPTQVSTLNDVGNSLPSQFFAEYGGHINRQSGRFFAGDAVVNSGGNTTANNDWLTTFQLSNGRANGFIQTTQGALLQSQNSSASSAWIVAAQTLNFADGRGAVAQTEISVNNNTTQNGAAFAGYAEAYRMSGAAGGAYGKEIDTINYAGLVQIDPFQQNIAQVIGHQMSSGGNVGGTQFPASAAYNIRNNNSTFDKGINFGYNSINGTNGTDGNIGTAIAMATGHAIDYYYGAGTRSWRAAADIGANGNFNYTTTGSGAFSVPSLLEVTGQSWTSYTPTVTAQSGAFTTVSATGVYRQLGKSISVQIRIIITTNGSAAGYVSATLPFTAATNFILCGRENAVSGKMLQGYINSGSVQIYNYDNTYPGANSAVLTISGVYEST